jgi:hypothetical protein
LTPAGVERYAGRVKRLELTRVRLCQRCGRGGAELRSGDGRVIVVPMDGARARGLEDDAGTSDGLESLTDLVLGQLAATGRAPTEIVLDVLDGRLRALLSLPARDGPRVVGCTPEEGVALAVRGRIPLYATDEALAHAAARAARHERGSGGADTLH